MRVMNISIVQRDRCGKNKNFGLFFLYKEYFTKSQKFVICVCLENY